MIRLARSCISRTRSDVAAATRWYMEPIDFLTMRFSGVASPHTLHDSRRGSPIYGTSMTIATTSTTEGDRHRRFKAAASLALWFRCRAGNDRGGNRTGDLSTTRWSSRACLTCTPPRSARAATNLYDTHLALSTTSWISCPVEKKKTDIAHSIASVPGLTNDSYAIINSQNTGARALEWLRGVLASDGAALSLRRVERSCGIVATGSSRSAVHPVACRRAFAR